MKVEEQKFEVIDLVLWVFFPLLDTLYGKVPMITLMAIFLAIGVSFGGLLGGAIGYLLLAACFEFREVWGSDNGKD